MVQMIKCRNCNSKDLKKDSKTKNVKEITIQFTFFDYKEYKKTKSYIYWKASCKLDISLKKNK